MLEYSITLYKVLDHSGMFLNALFFGLKFLLEQILFGATKTTLTLTTLINPLVAMTFETCMHVQKELAYPGNISSVHEWISLKF